MKPVLKGAVALSLLCIPLLLGASTSGASIDETYRPMGAVPAPGTISVLTYNVHGLPWPVASGRSADLRRIGSRLRQMRAAGRAPSIVLLQEAFTDDAQVIAAGAGYRHITRGPSKDDINAGTMTTADRAFAADAHWWKGETEGKLVGSGLQILSDYDILAVHRIAFPEFACAGWDCLANKGAMLVTLAIPGGSPIDVLTTHLNSRHASRVPNARSDYAYARQVEALTTFIHAFHDPAYPLIAGGDFNVGAGRARRDALLTNAPGWSRSAIVRDAMHEYRRGGGVMSADAAYSFTRSRDWQFFSDGTTGKLSLVDIQVPFGFEPDGGMLSDHVGYVARFRLSGGAKSTRAATRTARRTV